MKAGKDNGSRTSYRVLVIACKPDHLKILSEACLAAHQQVVPCHNIADAFDFIKRRDHVDVLVSEAFMEDESVFDFLIAAKNSQELRDVPIMIVASEPGDIGQFCMPNIVHVSECLGAYKFIVLPKFNAEMLVREIQAILPEERPPKRGEY